jgi:hypothetical protein
MLWEVFHFLLSFAEVVAVIALILFVGLTIAVAVFWILSRSLGKRADPAAGFESYDEEMDGSAEDPDRDPPSPRP